MEHRTDPVPTAGHAAITYLYLRVGIIAMVVLLAVAVTLEDRGILASWFPPAFSSATPGVFGSGEATTGVEPFTLGSISASWYSPVRSVFVAVIVAAGVALIALRGRGLSEPLLNLSGIFAPVVAFVPTPEPLKENCFRTESSNPLAGQQPTGDTVSTWNTAACNEWVLRAESSMAAYLVVGSVVILVAAVFVFRRRSSGPEFTGFGDWWNQRVRGVSNEQPNRTEEIVGIALAVAMWLAMVWWFLAGRESFLLNAHIVAAGVVFVPLALVAFLAGVAAWSNGRADLGTAQRVIRRAYTPVYWLIAVAMLAGLTITATALVWGWNWFGLVSENARSFYNLEFVILFSFLAYWVLQTVDEWAETRAALATERLL